MHGTDRPLIEISVISHLKRPFHGSSGYSPTTENGGLGAAGVLSI